MPIMKMPDLLRLRQPGIYVDSNGGQYSFSTIAISRRNYMDSGSGRVSAPTGTNAPQHRA